MGLIRRCSACRRGKVRYSAKAIECDHREAVWGIKYRVGSRQIFKTIGTNKRDAERHLLKIKSEIACSGSHQEIRPMLFKEIAAQWIRNYEQSPNKKHGTIWAYSSRLRLHILPVLGNKIANQITAYDLEIIKQKLREKLSARYTNAILVNIGTIMKYAWRLGFCSSNPAQLVTRYGVDKGASTTITPDEAALLSRHLNEPFKTIFFVSLATGARIGEVVGLMWKDIDFRNDLISIERNVFHASKNKYGMADKSWVFGTPKSKESVRKIYMVPVLKRALLRHSETTQGNALGLVFCTTKGNPYDRSTLRSKLNSALKAAGLKHIRIHDLRHSCATWLLNSGVDLPYVSRHLGHSKVAITTDIYYHFLPKGSSHHLKLMDNVFPTWDTTATPSPPPLDATKQESSSR